MSIEEKLQSASEKLDVPGALVVSGDKTGTSASTPHPSSEDSDITTGSFHYSKTFGVSSLKDTAASNPLELESTFWLASCTKLITAIAALQCVERRQFTLDEDVTRLLPELKNTEILKGFEEGSEKPILLQSTKKITLR